MFFKIFISVLITCTPLTIQAQNKVILLVPRQVRRVQNPGSPLPWRQFLRQPFMKAVHFLDNEFLPSQSPSRPYINHQYRSKNRPATYNKNLPHGGDDFDQGHEQVNHIIVPHGVGITHGITFGKGYVPHEALMDHAGFSSNPSGNHETTEDSSKYQFQTPMYSPLQLTQQIDTYYQNEDANTQQQDEGQERRADDLALKLMNIKSIGKIHRNYDNKKSSIATRGIPQQTIGGPRKPGIILQDIVGLDDYNRQVLELTSTWPKPLDSPTAGVLSTTGGYKSDGIISQFGGVAQPLISHPVDLNNYHGSTQRFTSPYDNTNSHQSQGYSVKEDVEDVPNDFRAMPIRTAPVQTAGIHQQKQLQVAVTSQSNNNFNHLQGFSSNIHATSQAVPGYFALAGLVNPGIAHQH
ncbi:hypothetical protein PV327_003497 [Microctonus hyperodae]|uniref:Uncharacterized protein n=1 Tax=Microctonus hyperodae TaxID=165561 RepID=A0AA39L0Y2_MICHY|nr:hypothetical protein PV327_003497 [Microctonus hyperodae]